MRTSFAGFLRYPGHEAMKPTSYLLFLFAFLSGLLCAVQAWALDPARSIAQYIHTKWTLADGAPGNILAIVQSTDGYLWLGTASGLYRFDGITFERIPPIEGDSPRSDQVTALFAAPSGDIWVGYFWGGIAIFRDGKLHDFNHGPPQGTVISFAQDADGGIWVATEGVIPTGLSRYANGKWQSFGAESGIPQEEFRGILPTKDGAVWLATQTRTLVLRRGSARFDPPSNLSSARGQAELPFDNAGFATDLRGRPWVSDCRGLHLLGDEQQSAGTEGASASTRPCASPDSVPKTILFDRDGSVWEARQSGGILRIRDPSATTIAAAASSAGSADIFGVSDGLSSDSTKAIFEDREGDIWVGTSGGLDRFRAANIVTELGIRTQANGKYTAMRGAGGAIVIADDQNAEWEEKPENHTLYRILPGMSAVAVSQALNGFVMTLCQTNDGKIPFITSTGEVLILDGDKILKYANLPNLKSAGIFGCVIDKYGMLWVSTFNDGLYRFNGKMLEEFNAFPNIPHLSPYLLSLDKEGRLLSYFGRRSLVRIDGDRIETLLAANDVQIGFVHAIASGPRYILLGGETGLTQIDGDRIRTLPSSRYPWLRDVSDITQTSRGETWLIGIDGIVRLSTAALERAFDDPGQPLDRTLLDVTDGLPTLYDPQSDTGPNNLEGGDGRVWFLTTGHVVWLDPAHLTHNPLPPPVSIQRLVANDSRYALPLKEALPKGVSKLEIDYTALSLSFPQRNRFRYRLDGVDDDWVDPGVRRQAFYTNLGPGHYRFTVIAANNDGIWNTTGATLAFDIPPTFVQSTPFKALCIALALVLAWLLYSLRLRQMAGRIRGRLEERLAERERIARELHDTLLQGFQGLMLRFQAATDQIPAEQPARGMMEQALDRAEDVLVEGRDRVRNLRTAQAAGEFSRMLADAADRLGFDPQISVRVIVEGTPRDLHPAVRDEIVAIGKEALFNISCHANAKAIEIYIRHGKQLDVKFIDDGVGIDQATLEQGRDGHFGLTGMRERAAKIRASLVITSRVGAGTEIALAVPASVAYAGNGKNFWRWPLHQPEPRES